MPIEFLRDLLFHTPQLHMPINASLPSADAPHETPLSVGGDLVVDDLGGGGDGLVAIKDLNGRLVSGKGPVRD